jgi:RIO-like serine/threonine protein kinase
VNERESALELKHDLFGTVRRLRDFDGRLLVERDTRAARWWIAPLARMLAHREARALELLDRRRPQAAAVPQLLAWDGRSLRRSWIEGRPMHLAQPRDPAYYREALRLLRHLHASSLVHNDLAKEPNWLVMPDGRPALVDFQLASGPHRRGWWFKARAWDDLRHLLKHKRSYCPQRLTARQHAMLARRSPLAATWARTGKPLYRLVTRGVLGWADREGAGDRRHGR